MDNAPNWSCYLPHYQGEEAMNLIIQLRNTWSILVRSCIFRFMPDEAEDFPVFLARLLIWRKPNKICLTFYSPCRLQFRSKSSSLSAHMNKEGLLIWKLTLISLDYLVKIQKNPDALTPNQNLKINIYFTRSPGQNPKRFWRLDTKSKLVCVYFELNSMLS